MIYEHLVFDDLREFDPPIDGVTYCRNTQEAQDALMNGYNHICNLWLDFDLGMDDTTLSIVNDLASMSIHDAGKCTVDNVFIVTANPVGRDRIFGLCEMFADSVKVVNPLDHNLVNKTKW